MSDDLVIPADAKKPWQSRTLIGAAVVIASAIAGLWKIKIDVANLTDILVQVSAILGAALAIYGRIKATQPITFTGGTKPGGPFNPSAEVKKAMPVKSESGTAAADTLVLVGLIFLLAGIGAFAFPTVQRMTQRPEPEVIAHRAVCEWMQIVTLEDKRPFFTRLLSSIHCTPTAALVTTASGTAPHITKIEISGGADF